ncbi:hypothetical protein OKA04_07605 [Luteolibacter flavescens]|uniref:Uncharacterized protein n=1 Tax=Luteolibacter flavescens TaxID=1859460 RepID=A0ABT3FMM0_9BACT|nr:hypothetical protein [Luteolibacter flavescens]MCW1884594.1 hypothetical protein [Luteolibacter flavescens]
MYSRTALITLAALTVPLSAQIIVQGGAVSGAVIGGVPGQPMVIEVQDGEPAEGMLPPAGAMAALAAGGAEGGDVDFNRLRQMIEQSKNRPAPTVEQQKAGILRELQFDRSPAGILATRMEEAREAAAAKNPQPAHPAPPAPPAPVAPPAPPVAPPAAPAVEGVPATPEGGMTPEGAPGVEGAVVPAPEVAPAPVAPPAPQKPSPDAAKAQAELEQFRKDAAVFRRDVVLGRWDKVKAFLAGLPPQLSAEAYQNVVARLSAPSPVQPTPDLIARGAKPHTQPALLSTDDLLGLAAAAPKPPQKAQIKGLAKMLPKDPRPPKEFFDALAKGIQHFGGEDPASRQRAAEFLMEAGFVKDATPFLPDLATAKEKKDYAALNLIARHRADLYQLDKKDAGKDALPLAWELSTSFLTDAKAPAPAKAEALFRALSLIPQLGDDTGKLWLEKTFKNPQGEGVELLATLGTLTAQTRENPDQTLRLEQLKLQHAAVTTILATKDVDPAAWSGIFTIYAEQWAYEAGVTQVKDQSNTRRMVPQYDEWGNLFYSRPNTGFQGPGVRPIGAGELLECKPDEKWLASIQSSSRNECLLAAARLHLKVKEENQALPVIKTLAATDKEQAKALVRETIKVWTENNNPNEGQNYRSQYMYFYGFNNQSGAIPLTRSKQERNLVELAALVKGVSELDLGESFHTEFANAFISCHSQAEVWRVEAVESVFGATDVLDSDTLATLVGKMRLNLAGLWPNPKVQQAFQTKRKDKELQEQIFTGYKAAQGVLERALLKKPAQAWRLEEQLAGLRFEESNYRSSLEGNHEHSKTKRASLDMLAAAAGEYAASLPLEDPSDETSAIFETWFYAALGSPSLEALKSNHVATPEEYAKIKQALDSLPGDTKARHLKSFATTINNRLANVAPDLKLRYLEAAGAVIGDHPAMRDASDVLAYYRDLITEIQLDATVDGSDRVGTDQAFGLRVNLRHTREIEREAGGFQKYLQNQNSMQYAWNFGRPTEDYRDKFEKAARAALEEHFEVVSLTFHTDKVESQTDPKFGWRYTPYAYFMLKPKGPQVDKVPPLKLDLDFNDTSGYVVLPVTSAEVLIDAGKSEPRPFRDLKVTQTLDERSHAEKGSLFLEVKATAHGLIPPLGELMSETYDGFEVGNIEDRGLRVVEMDAAADDFAPISEHEWRIELKPEGGSLPASFEFPTVKQELAKEDGLTRQRYVDVDLQPVGERVELGGSAGGSETMVLGGLMALAVIAAAVLGTAKRRKAPHHDGPELAPLPAQMNVVSVIGYLRRLQQRAGTTPMMKREIEKEIVELEAKHFGRADTPEDTMQLESIAKRWQTA